MRLTRIHIRGYKRLVDAACNVDGRLIALLGPNEAGKSSVLEAFAWLSEEDSGPLEVPRRSRSVAAETNQPVIRVRFVLDKEDLAALAGLDTDITPRTFTLAKMLDGSYRTSMAPALERSRRPLDKAGASLDKFEQRFSDRISTGPTAQDGPVAWIGAIRTSLAQDDDDRANCLDEVASLREWCADLIGDEENVTGKDAQAAVDFLVVLEDLQTRLKEDPPDVQGREILKSRTPQFLLFAEQDRVLESEYNLADGQLHASVPRALENLLTLGGTTLKELRAVQKSLDTSRLKSLVKDVNNRLTAELHPTWRQAKLSVAIGVEAETLQILIDEDAGGTTVIQERSDGLKSFIALVCFLARHHSAVPPILMLDEAETHLHYDAQADLIEVLLHRVVTSKVIYTTHSPGCLPPDLGTGIRLVAPVPGKYESRLRNDFWSSNEPGFSPLLFAMGASAAAFSVCRRAVLAEGPSDMILLPTLIRAATGLSEIGYQVAPGLSSVSPSDLSSDAVAATVAYLVDGDDAGDSKRQALVATGVANERIFSLPARHAMEDLLTPECYLAAVNSVLADAGSAVGPLTPEMLAGSGPISSRVRAYCKNKGAPDPGKTAVASRLVRNSEDLQLTHDGVKALRALHRRLTKVLG